MYCAILCNYLFYIIYLNMLSLAQDTVLYDGMINEQ